MGMYVSQGVAARWVRTILIPYMGWNFAWLRGRLPTKETDVSIGLRESLNLCGNGEGVILQPVPQSTDVFSRELIQVPGGYPPDTPYTRLTSVGS